MCLELKPLKLSSGLTIRIPCQKCWQCRSDRVTNWTGKVIAESKTSVAVDFITLTMANVSYNETHPKEQQVKKPVPNGYEKLLVYPDFQKYMKRVRKKYPCRYVVAGEYGDQKGRAHWHIIMFWLRERPPRRDWAWQKHKWIKKGSDEHLYGREYQDEFWPHGMVHYRKFDQGSAQYVCKYLRKTEWMAKEANRKIEFHYSSRPGIGFKWMVEHWAQLHVDQGLAPQKPLFSFREVERKGKRVQFYMSPHTQAKFAEAFERRWYEQKGDHPPASPFLEKMNDLKARVPVSDALERRPYAHFPDIPPDGEEEEIIGYDGRPRRIMHSPPVLFDDQLNMYYYFVGFREKYVDGEGNAKVRWRYFYEHGLRWWSFNERGEAAWRERRLTPSEGRRLRASYERNNSSEVHAEATMKSARSRAA